MLNRHQFLYKPLLKFNLHSLNACLVAKHFKKGICTRFDPKIEQFLICVKKFK